jgi:hypothetical protein
MERVVECIRHCLHLCEAVDVHMAKDPTFWRLSQLCRESCYEAGDFVFEEHERRKEAKG